MKMSKPVTHQTKQTLQQAILITLQNITLQRNKQYNNQQTPQSEWPTTRNIAEIHDISIYKARMELLDMVEKGLLTVSERSISNSLRWFPLDEKTSCTHNDNKSES